jgi:hypothetical protein
LLVERVRPTGRVGPKEPPNRCPPTTIEDALGQQSFTVLLPAHALANDASVAEVRRCPYPELRIAYSSGVDLLLDATMTWTDPAESWEGLARVEPDWRTVGTVRGQPALLSDPAKSDETVGGVEFVMEANLLVNITGNGEIPLEDLIEVAQSLKEVN